MKENKNSIILDFLKQPLKIDLKAILMSKNISDDEKLKLIEDEYKKDFIANNYTYNFKKETKETKEIKEIIKYFSFYKENLVIKNYISNLNKYIFNTKGLIKVYNKIVKKSSDNEEKEIILKNLERNKIKLKESELILSYLNKHGRNIKLLKL